jgi:hypothetical protein
MRTRRQFGVAVLGAVLAVLLAGRARADVIITFSQQGTDVVATTSGSLNLSALTQAGVAGPITTPFLFPVDGGVSFGGISATYERYAGVSFMPSQAFGTGGLTNTTSHSGAPFGLDGTGVLTGGVLPELLVPIGFTGGTITSSTDTWANTTINALGLTPGTYTWTWGSVANGNADSLEVVIPAASAVPEPSSVALLGIGTISLLGYGWRRRKLPV